jgi:hypothetical protein
VGTDRTPITTLFYVPETRRFGFSYAFEGHAPHHIIRSCPTLQDALDHCDPHREHVWEDPSDDDENAVLVSRGYKEGSVMWKMTRYTVTELAAQRSAAGR